MSLKVIGRVIVWDTGQVSVFDGYGNPMPEYQGKWEDMKVKIMQNKPEDVEVENLVWRNL